MTLLDETFIFNLAKWEFRRHEKDRLIFFFFLLSTDTVSVNIPLNKYIPPSVIKLVTRHQVPYKCAANLI